MKPIRLILIPSLANAPAPYLVVGADGVVRERGSLALDAAVAPETMRTVAVVPGAEVTLRWLDLPPGGAAQVRAAAAWSLRDAVAAAPERLATVVGPPTPAGEPRLAAVVSRALLQAWVDYLEALGVRAEVIVPDVLTLPEPADDGALTVVAFGESLALRGRRFAATVQPELADLMAGERTLVPLEDPGELERILVAAARAPAINLLDALQRDAARVGGWRRAAALAAAVLVSPLILTLSAAARDDLAARRLEDETRALIVRNAPDLARSADPVAAVHRRAQAAPPPGGVTAAAAALFAAVETVEGAELDILIADPGDGVKATVSHPAYGDMAAIRSAMAEAGMTVTETGTLDDAGRVVSDITIGGLS